MSVKFKPIAIIAILIFSFSGTCFSQTKNVDADSVLWWKFHFLGSADYPESLIKSNQPVIAFGRIKFSNKKKNLVKSVEIFNTDNYEVIEKLKEGIKKIDFSKFRERFSMILVPFIFKNFDEISDYPINLKESELAKIFDKKMNNNGKYTCKFLWTVYCPYYSPQPPKR